MDIGKPSMETTIYNVPGENGERMGEMSAESAGPQMEKKFINAVIDLVVDAIDVGWNDRRVVAPLLRKILTEPMDRRWKSSGLLQQYEAYVLELAGERIKKDLEIPEEVKINHSHATHAKFADITDYLKAEDKEAWLEKFNKSKKTG